MNNQNLLFKANQCLEEGDYNQAINLYQQCLELEPENRHYYWYLGLAYLLNNCLEDAQDIWMSVLLQASSENMEIWTKELGDILNQELNKQSQKNNIIQIKRIYDTLLELDNSYYSGKIENQINKNIDQIKKEALSLSWLKDFDGAEHRYKFILELDNNSHETWHYLGLIYYQKELYQDAYECIQTALELNDLVGLYHYSLGLVLEKLGSEKLAIKGYEESIRLNPHFPDAYNQLGIIYKKNQDLEKAKIIYQQGIEANPEHLGCYINLGNILVEIKEYDNAIETYQKILKINKIYESSPDIYHNIAFAYQQKNDKEQANLYYGLAAYKDGKYDQAITYYEKYLETNQGDVSVYFNLADSYINDNQIEIALITYKKGISYYPDSHLLYTFLIRGYQRAGYIDEALTTLEYCFANFDNNLLFKVLDQCLLPTIYETTEEIDRWRSIFIEKLEQLISLVLSSENNKKEMLNHLNVQSNYYLNFQGRDDRNIQEKYGNFVHEIMKFNYPQWCKPVSSFNLNLINQEKIRIAYVSNRLHSIGTLHLGWLRYSNKDKFEIFTYDLGNEIGPFNEQYRLYSNYYYHLPEQLEACCEQLEQDKPHIIVYLQVGLDPIMNKLAGLRLAPIQCSTWGHPITTGSPTIDYFLSSEAMEPANAQKHYTEKLVKLPKLGVCFPKIKLPEEVKTLGELGLKEDNTIYLCCQMLQKYYPQYDDIFPLIAQQVPTAKFVFFELISDRVVNLLKQRLKKSFDKFNLNIDSFVIFLKRVPRDEYLNINLISDVFLDTFDWSGGITSIDAIACSLPIVSTPGQLMRGNQSVGMLNIMGVTDTIAKNKEEYIKIAVKLGLDRAWGQEIKDKMKKNQNLLFNDLTCIQALENFYQESIKAKS